MVLVQHSVQTWFQTNAKAKHLVKPKTIEELRSMDFGDPYFCIGAGSNTLIRDKGFDGTVIKLSGDFQRIDVDGDRVVIGAACLNRMAVHFCSEQELSGLEFLIGIPGSIGGAIAMNAGALSYEIKDFLISCDIMMLDGLIRTYTKDMLNMRYRHTDIPEGGIILQGVFQLVKKPRLEIEVKIHEFLAHRNEAQPIKGRTGGSTFKNPLPHKAWELIDAVGLRGYRIGGAEFSNKHCNFIMNIENATASDIEALGDLACQRVYEKFGVVLEWEIKRIGEK